MQRPGQKSNGDFDAAKPLENFIEIAVHPHCSDVGLATATGARPAQRCNAGGATHSHSRGTPVLSRTLTRADKRAESPSTRPATSFKNDERNSPRGGRPMSGFARPGSGSNEPSAVAGAALSASAMPRSSGRGREAGAITGLTRVRLHQIAEQPLSDRAPAARLLVPAGRPIRVLPSINAIAIREHCGGDCRLDECGHHQPLSAGNICGEASRVTLKTEAFVQ